MQTYDTGHQILEYLLKRIDYYRIMDFFIPSFIRQDDMRYYKYKTRTNEQYIQCWQKYIYPKMRFYLEMVTSDKLKYEISRMELVKKNMELGEKYLGRYLIHL